MLALFQFDGSVPALGQLSNHGQAEARPARRCTAPSIEAFGNALSLIRRDSRPPILDDETNPVSVAGRTERYLARRVPDGVVDQVVEDLTDVLGVRARGHAVSSQGL